MPPGLPLRTARRNAGAPLRRACAAHALALALGVLSALPAEAQLVVAQAAPASRPVHGRSAAAPRDAAASEAALARGNAASAVLTREQLRRCMAEQQRLSAETDAIAATQHALEGDRAEIVRLAGELKARAAVLDRTDSGAVEAYNAQAEARNALIGRYDAATARTNARVEALEPARLAWSRDCAERAFRQQDRDAITSGR